MFFGETTIRIDGIAIVFNGLSIHRSGLVDYKLLLFIMLLNRIFLTKYPCSRAVSVLNDGSIQTITYSLNVNTNTNKASGMIETEKYLTSGKVSSTNNQVSWIFNK